MAVQSLLGTLVVAAALISASKSPCTQIDPPTTPNPALTDGSEAFVDSLRRAWGERVFEQVNAEVQSRLKCSLRSVVATEFKTSPMAATDAAERWRGLTFLRTALVVPSLAPAKFGTPLPTTKEIVSSDRDAIVRVTILDDAGSVIGVGSAFFVSENAAITCLHVVEQAFQIRLERGDKQTAVSRVAIPSTFLPLVS